jgi:hypothetical protein
MTDTIDQETIDRALERPSDFAYFGDRPLFETWGLCGPMTHRDADALTASNYRVILKNMQERFPDDVDTLSSSHWAVGWCEQIMVRVINDDGTPTEAFAALLEWSGALAEYPVADEEDYCELEREEFLEALEYGLWPTEFTTDNGDTYELCAPSYDELASALYHHADACRADDVSEQGYIDTHIAEGWTKLVQEDDE